MTEPRTDAETLAAVLDAVEAQHAPALELLEALVAIPSTGGSAAEVEVQHVLADVLAGDGCAVELWPLDLDELAADCEADGVWEFLLTAPPIKFTSAVGSPINPLAIK